jgi:hypothetical protein
LATVFLIRRATRRTYRRRALEFLAILLERGSPARSAHWRSNNGIRALREQLGREPTAEEIKAERDRLIRCAYADMAISALTFEDEAMDFLREQARGQPPVSTDAPLIFRPAEPPGDWIDESYDVLADGVVIGGIVKFNGPAAGPEPWKWWIDYYIEGRTPAHAHAPTLNEAEAKCREYWTKAMEARAVGGKDDG